MREGASTPPLQAGAGRRPASSHDEHGWLLRRRHACSPATLAHMAKPAATQRIASATFFASAIRTSNTPATCCWSSPTMPGISYLEEADGRSMAACLDAPDHGLDTFNSRYAPTTWFGRYFIDNYLHRQTARRRSIFCFGTPTRPACRKRCTCSICDNFYRDPTRLTKGDLTAARRKAARPGRQ